MLLVVAKRYTAGVAREEKFSLYCDRSEGFPFRSAAGYRMCRTAVIDWFVDMKGILLVVFGMCRSGIECWAVGSVCTHVRFVPPAGTGHGKLRHIVRLG